VHPPQHLQHLPHLDLPVRHLAPLSRREHGRAPAPGVGSRSWEYPDPPGSWS
jgi:hypothetical protein